MGFLRFIARSSSLGILLWSVASVTAAEELPRQRAGKYEVSLRLPPEGLYAQEEMQIEFRVVDATQVDPILGPTPVIRARIQGAVLMPAMPGMPKYEEIAHPEGVPGEYGVHPTFAHGGDYELQLNIAPPADAPFNVTFPLKVGDADEARNRKPRPRPFSVELKTSPRNPRPGEPVDLQLTIRAREKPKEAFAFFETVHEKLMHLLIVRDDLTQFAHEHPELSGDGVFRLRFAFPAAGEYHLFADTAPKAAGSQVMMVKLKVQGKPGSRYEVDRAPAADRSRLKKAGDLQVELEMPESLPAKRTSPLSFVVKDAVTGQPVTDLEPYLGAMGHFVLIHQDATTFVHSHPDESIPGVGRDGKVPFLVRFPKPGVYRGWVQFQRHGVVATADFILHAGAEMAVSGSQ